MRGETQLCMTVALPPSMRVVLNRITRERKRRMDTKKRGGERGEMIYNLGKCIKVSVENSDL